MKRAATTAAAVLVLAGCGGSAAPPRVAKPPRIPRALAHTWAAEAAAVAQALAEHDGCTAVAHADELRAAVDASSGQVAPRLRAKLLAVVDPLPGRITCNPAPPPPAPHDHGKHEGHGHGHGHGEGDQG